VSPFTEVVQELRKALTTVLFSVEPCHNGQINLSHRPHLPYARIEILQMRTRKCYFDIFSTKRFNSEFRHERRREIPKTDGLNLPKTLAMDFASRRCRAALHWTFVIRCSATIMSAGSQNQPGMGGSKPPAR